MGFTASILPVHLVPTVLAMLWLQACSLDRAPALSEERQSAGTAEGTGASGNQAPAGSGGAGGLAGVGVAGTGGVVAPMVDGAMADPANQLDAAVEAGPQGYTPGAIGAPCQVDSECMEGGMARTCFTETSFAPLLTLPGGYCGRLCDLSMTMTPCEVGAVCITIPTFPPVPVCMRECLSDSDCRVQDGYSCNLPFTSTASVCSLPN